MPCRLTNFTVKWLCLNTDHSLIFCRLCWDCLFWATISYFERLSVVFGGSIFLISYQVKFRVAILKFYTVYRWSHVRYWCNMMYTGRLMFHPVILLSYDVYRGVLGVPCCPLWFSFLCFLVGLVTLDAVYAVVLFVYCCFDCWWDLCTLGIECIVDDQDVDSRIVSSWEIRLRNDLKDSRANFY